MISLYIENEYIELDNEVQFAITKTFEDLSNPTLIINDWSKTVAIPFTDKNNKTFGHIYNPDRLTVESDIYTTGLYFNPLKKLNFRLEWDSAVIMTGYAKMLSVTQTNGTGRYNITLNGELGKVFQEMKKITFDNSTEEEKYLIKGGEYVDEFITKKLVYKSWVSTGQSRSDVQHKGSWGLNLETGDEMFVMNPKYKVTDIIGFSPNNAFTDNFDYKTFQIGENESTTFIDTLNEGIEGFPTFEEITGISPNTLIPNGITPRGKGEFRSYLQLPWIYFNKLFQIFQLKAESVTGYKFELDNTWFNTNNPYWYDLVYMLKPFNAKDGGTNLNTYESIGHHNYADTSTSTTVYPPNIIEDGAYCVLYQNPSSSGFTTKLLTPMSVTLTSDNVKAIETMPLVEDGMTIELSPNDRVVTQAFQFNGLVEVYMGNNPLTQDTWKCFSFSDDAALLVNIVYTGANGFVKKQQGAVIREDATTAMQNLAEASTTKSTISKFANRPNQNVNNIPRYTGAVWEFSLNFPEEALNYKDFGDYVTISFETFYRFGADASLPFDIEIIGTDDGLATAPPWNENYYFATVLNFDSVLRVTTGIFRSGSRFTLNDLWNYEYNILDEILKYCKAYRISITVDDINKTIIFKPFTKYFENYTISNWSNKIDTSKEFTVTPVTFENKYVLFNYEDTEIKNLKLYKEKYGVNYGEYKLTTAYNFNEDTTNLFDKRKTGSLISPAILTWDAIFRNNMIIYTVPNENYIDNTQDDNKQVSTFGQYYFHNGLQNFTSENMPGVIITDDTQLMVDSQTYFYADTYTGSHVMADTFPNLSLFNGTNIVTYTTPSEIYTVGTDVTGLNGIYNNFWEDYINERYNIQNKKITCYVKLSPLEYYNFNFNQFVQLGNQLCMVNKIYDYNLTNNEPTKIDLITIQDINAYTTNNYEKNK